MAKKNGGKGEKQTTKNTEQPSSLKKRVLELEKNLVALQETITEQLQQLADRQSALLRKSAG